MKVLYISHAFEGTGYSYAAHGYIQAMLAAGIDVVSRHVKLNDFNGEVPTFLKECENKNLDGCTHVIQHVLPHHMSYIPNMKNIGLCVHDTSSLRYVEWDRFLNCMDEVWIPQTHPTFKSELDVPVKYVPHAFDTTRYSKKDIEPLDIKEVGGSCVFYTIGELIIRKNFRDSIIAFQSEFHSNEPVNFIIKSGLDGSTPEECASIIAQSINGIKQDLKLYPRIEDYKQEIIITSKVPQEQIEQIHRTGYCYLNTSRGEGWCMPQFDAWAYGNRIVHYSSKLNDYAYLRDSSTVHYVTCQPTNVFAYKETFPQLGTAREEWLDSSIPALRKAMRGVYNEWLGNPEKVTNITYENYSYESVGKMIKEIL